jgi:hypothetical protein
VLQTAVEVFEQQLNEVCRFAAIEHWLAMPRLMQQYFAGGRIEQQAFIRHMVVGIRVVVVRIDECGAKMKHDRSFFYGGMPSGTGFEYWLNEFFGDHPPVDNRNGYWLTAGNAPYQSLQGIAIAAVAVYYDYGFKTLPVKIFDDLFKKLFKHFFRKETGGGCLGEHIGKAVFKRRGNRPLKIYAEFLCQLFGADSVCANGKMPPMRLDRSDRQKQRGLARKQRFYLYRVHVFDKPGKGSGHL